MLIKSKKPHTGPPESKKFEVDIGSGVNAEPQIFAGEDDPVIRGNDDGKDTFDEVPVGERTPEPEIIEEETPIEESSESIEEEELREHFEPKFFENFFPETDQDFARDQAELRERIGILKSLEDRYKDKRYVPITMNELTDTLMIFEELLDLRQMSQDFGRAHDDYLEKLREQDEEVETEDGITGELFEGLDDEEEEEEEDNEEDVNPWEIEEDIHHENEEEHLEEEWDSDEDHQHDEEHEEDDDWELGNSSEEHYHENEHDQFIEHEAEEIAAKHEHDNEDDIHGHDIIEDSDIIHNLIDKVQHNENVDLISPNMSELSYDSVNIKRTQNHETLNDEITVIEGLEIIFQKIFLGVPDDKEYLNGITSQDHSDVEELFGIVHDFMEEYNKDEEETTEELNFLIKTIALLPVSNDHILQFFDLFEKYHEIGTKMKAADYTCQQKDKKVTLDIKLFVGKIQMILKDLNNMSSVLVSIKNESTKIGNRIEALTERSDDIDYIDKYDIAISFVPTLIDAKSMISQKLSETREILMYMPHTKETIEETIDDYDLCASG